MQIVMALQEVREGRPREVISVETSLTIFMKEVIGRSRARLGESGHRTEGFLSI